MIQHQIDNMLNELNYQLQYQGFGLQQLLEMTGRTMEELREERKEDANKEDIKGQIKIRKTIDLLVDNATIA